MGRRSTGSVKPKGTDRIEFNFRIGGVRYRPTLAITPTEANLRRAAKRLEGILDRIKHGSFAFSDEFPEYRFLDKVASGGQGTFDQVADAFLASIGDLEYATRESYRKILKHHWRPKFGQRDFLTIKATELKAFIGGAAWVSNKTRNNVLSVGKRVFDFGYGDHPDRMDPATRLKSLRVQRPKPDPFTLDEAEAIIAGLREDHGVQVANYFEWQLYTGCRPSETIALGWADWDRTTGAVRVKGARVMGKDKGTTKTAVERDLEPCPRAASVIHRQRAATELLSHGRIFARPDGKPWHDLQLQWKAWDATLKRMVRQRVLGRYREPYQCRHTSVTWNLLVGKPLLWVAEQHGHSPAVMLKTYVKWLKGTDAAAVERIRAAMNLVPDVVPETGTAGGKRGRGRPSLIVSR